MMAGDSRVGWRSPWVRGSIVALAVLTVLSFLVGFLWLPSVQPDYTAGGWWSSICRAAGVPSDWGGSAAGGMRATRPSTEVVLDRTMARPGRSDAVGRGATLALNCTMCHGAQGMSASEAPNLAGQYPEVVIKQLDDYRDGRRQSPFMQSLARRLSDGDIADLAAYFAYLPKARTAPTTYSDALPALVRVGAPLRNIAPCISCHGAVDQKLGAPWLEGMPKAYLVAQLKAFASGARHNDAFAQMRNMARPMTGDEMDAVATFYAGRAPVDGHAPAH
jgi:cytochrome c553